VKVACLKWCEKVNKVNSIRCNIAMDVQKVFGITVYTIALLRASNGGQVSMSAILDVSLCRMPIGGHQGIRA
jgi:hypothetical protein